MPMRIPDDLPDSCCIIRLDPPTIAFLFSDSTLPLACKTCSSRPLLFFRSDYDPISLIYLNTYMRIIM